jgi:hypothetical protein
VILAVGLVLDYLMALFTRLVCPHSVLEKVKR